MTGGFLKHRPCINKSLPASENDLMILSPSAFSQIITSSTGIVSSYAMFFVALLAAAAVSASPVALQPRTAVLPLKHVSNISSVKNIVAKGQARLNKVNGIFAVDAADVSSGSVTNEDVTYVAPVTIGGSTWQLIVDTGCMSLLQNALETLY